MLQDHPFHFANAIPMLGNAVMVWEDRGLPTSVVYITLVWAIFLLFGCQHPEVASTDTRYPLFNQSPHSRKNMLMQLIGSGIIASAGVIICTTIIMPIMVHLLSKGVRVPGGLLFLLAPAPIAPSLWVTLLLPELPFDRASDHTLKATYHLQRLFTQWHPAVGHHERLIDVTLGLSGGSTSRSWCMVLIVQCILLKGVELYHSCKYSPVSAHEISSFNVYGTGFSQGRSFKHAITGWIPHGAGITITILACIYDPLATQIPAVIPIRDIVLFKANGQRVAVQDLVSMNHPDIPRHGTQQLGEKRQETQKDNPVWPTKDAMTSSVRSSSVPTNARAGTHHSAKVSSHKPPQVWVLWRSDCADCMKYLDHISYHQTHSPKIWKDVQIVIINEGDDTLTLTRTLKRLHPMNVHVVWDKQQYLMGAMKLKVLPLLLLMDGNEMARGVGRILDYRIGVSGLNLSI